MNESEVEKLEKEVIATKEKLDKLETTLNSLKFKLCKFYINTEQNRKEQLYEGEFYLTLYNGASGICISKYIDNDVWRDDKGNSLCTNKVSYFASRSPFDLIG